MSDVRVEPIDFGLQYLDLRRRLRQIRPALREMFDLAKDAALRLQQPFDATDDRWDVIGEVNVSPRLKHLEHVQVSRGMLDTYAGAVALILNDMLQTLIWTYGEAGGPQPAGATIAGSYTIADVLRAIANNFRHYEEWRRAKNLRDDARENIRIIAAAMNLQLPDESNHSFGNIVAWFVLDPISGGSYDKLEMLVRTFAYDMILRLGQQENVHFIFARNEDGVP